MYTNINSKELKVLMIKKTLLLFPLILASCSSAESASSSYHSSSENESNISSVSSEEESQIADVIILAGQSNCEGNSYVSYLRKNTGEEQRNLYKNGFENTLIRFSCNRGANKCNTFMPVKQGMGVSTERFGIEVGIAEALNDAGLAKKVYLIKYAVGGTTLYSDWHSPSSDFGASELYGNMIKFVNESLKQLEDENLIPVIKAFCWMQGESDASGSNSSAYYGLEKNFVQDMSQDLAYYASENGICFIDGGISDCSAWTNYKTINAAKKKLAEENPNHHKFIDTIAEKLEYGKEPEGNADIYHYDALSELKLGKLFGNIVLEEINK